MWCIVMALWRNAVHHVILFLVLKESFLDNVEHLYLMINVSPILNSEYLTLPFPVFISHSSKKKVFLSLGTMKMHLQTSETDGSTRTNGNSMGKDQNTQIVCAGYGQDHVIWLPKIRRVYTLWSQDHFLSVVARTSSWFIFMLILSGLGLRETSRLSFQNTILLHAGIYWWHLHLVSWIPLLTPLAVLVVYWL